MEKMTDNEKIVAFRQECRRYLDFRDKIDDIDKRLVMLKIKMENVHSPSFEKVGSSPSRRERPVTEMIEKKTELENRKAYYQRRMKWIIDTIELFPSPAYKALLWMTYIQCNSTENVSRIFDVSAGHMNHIRRKYLLQILTDQKLAEMKALQDEEPKYKHIIV